MNESRIIKRKVGVDTGQLLIIDPCYLKDLTAADLDTSENELVKQLGHAPDPPCKGVIICRTGMGDGIYTVDIETDEHRVKSITINFLPPGWAGWPEGD